MWLRIDSVRQSTSDIGSHRTMGIPNNQPRRPSTNIPPPNEQPICLERPPNNSQRTPIHERCVQTQSRRHNPQRTHHHRLYHNPKAYNPERPQPPTPPPRRTIGFRVDTRWTIANTDHLILWTTITHQLGNAPLKVHLLTTPSDSQPQHQQQYLDAVAKHLAGYTTKVHDLRRDVIETNAKTKQQGVDEAKQDLIDRIHKAVADSIGHKRPPNTHPTYRHAHTFKWTPEVKTALHQKQQASDAIDTAREQARLTADPTQDTDTHPMVQTALAQYKTTQQTYKQAKTTAKIQTEAEITSQAITCASMNHSKGM